MKSNSSSHHADTTFLPQIFAQNPAYFKNIVSNLDEYRVQVIYTEIDRKAGGRPVFHDHYFNVSDSNFYYPASTVKLPASILALQKLNELKIPGLNKYSTMITGENGDGQTSVINDPTAADGRPSIAHYIKKILLVSDNDAFNRLYEFLGQEYINQSLHARGYDSVQIIHRLVLSLTEAQNRHTNPIKFLDDSGKIIYEKPAMVSKFVYAPRNTFIGKGFMKDDKLINQPFDFSKKNRMSIPELHDILRSVIFPEAIPESRRFNLQQEDYNFLRKYMSMWPGESVFPNYEKGEYWDTYAKMFLYGIEKTPVDPTIRIFSKSGWSYGFLTETAYIVDWKNNVEFMLTATIYCNKDGILNDDNYDYKEIGYPFMKNLAQVLLDYERGRKRRNRPDLSKFQYTYK